MAAVASDRAQQVRRQAGTYHAVKPELWRSEAPEAARARGLAEPEVLVRLALPLPI